MSISRHRLFTSSQGLQQELKSTVVLTLQTTMSLSFLVSPVPNKVTLQQAESQTSKSFSTRLKGLKDDRCSLSFMELVLEVSTTIPLNSEGPIIVILLDINMTALVQKCRSQSPVSAEDSLCYASRISTLFSCSLLINAHAGVLVKGREWRAL